MRYLAIDFGDKRTGLAVGDDVTRIAGPVDVIETGTADQCLSRLGDAVDRHGVDALVVGLPLNMDGTEGAAARKCRELAQQLAQQCSLPVHLVDERLSSDHAEGKLDRTGLTHGQKKSRRDALAAATILQDFLDAL